MLDDPQRQKDGAYGARIKFFLLTDETQIKRFTDMPYLQKMEKFGGLWQRFTDMPYLQKMAKFGGVWYVET